MKTIERILCPTDLVSPVDEAISNALTLAVAFNARLHICHVSDAEHIIDERKEQIKRGLADAVKASAGHLTGLPLWEADLLSGEPVAAITRAAAERHADLIVMHSRHRSYASALLGSTTEAVCHQAPCPVLVTHPYEPEDAATETARAGFNRILMAHDFSLDSEVALMFSLALADEFDATLDLLHVLPSSSRSGDLLVPDERETRAAIERLEEAVPENISDQIEVRHVVKAGVPWREILAYAEEQDNDLICLGIRGTGLPQGDLAGSNADRVLREAPCPVLIARPLKPASFVLAESRVDG